MVGRRTSGKWDEGKPRARPQYHPDSGPCTQALKEVVESLPASGDDWPDCQGDPNAPKSMDEWYRNDDNWIAIVAS